MNKILTYVSLSLSLLCPSFVYGDITYTNNSDGTSSTTQEF